MKNISKSFFGKSALNNVDFELNKGEIHALLGENGAGKTTLIKTILNVFKKTSGEVKILGVDNTSDEYTNAK